MSFIRDVFYQNPLLFGSQSVVDRYCDLFARFLRVRRYDLGLKAAAKGLVIGSVIFSRPNGSALDLAREAEPLLISHLDAFTHADLSEASRILVIEKEATFHTARSSNAWLLIKRYTILMTAKGYPDLASRQLLHRLSTASPWNGFRDLPVLILTDFDPDGLAIFNTFKHGSNALEHEGPESAVPNATRLGLSSQHVKNYIDSIDCQALMSLTKRDRRKAQLMLQRGTGTDERRELQVMLMLNFKAELQLLDNEEDGLAQILMSVYDR
ncbi:DNA topoisomerase IV, alpha subunit [Myriangium duriaei CBS 260.36]|uniref:DNA topoisomerase (ATP-hydrolyzing) n=1 Tax=Myriangium duriaei CBS 260.36 TaxID=1168546 RepID=A0A9P4MKW1_9PEZI|nr:DNA topoisomerase IV, alpha subunit [Myriangium duriaei CBS 260.36]